MKGLHVTPLRFLSLLILFVAAPLTAEASNIQRVVSPHGIEAWLVEDHTLPLIAMSFAFEGGAAQDPAGKPGVANMLSGLLDEGAGDLDSQAFQSALDENAVELSFDAGRDAFTGSMKTLLDNRAEAVRLLRLALTSPRFDPEPVERIRAQIIAGIRSDSRDPDEVAGNALVATAFPGHPYGKAVEGTVDSVGTITPDDLRTYFRKNIARNNLKVAVVGAINKYELGRILDEVFDALPIKSDLADVAEIAPAAATQVDIPMAIPQAVIRFAGKGLKRSDPDFIPATVASFILGGGAFTSRLYEEVREKRGLAYSVSLGLSPLDHAGIVFGGTSTKSNQAGNVLTLIEDQIKRFASDGPTADELARAKSYLIGSYPLRFDTSGKIASQLLGIQLDNLGIDYVDRRNGLIAAVTIDDVRRVAKRLFASDLIVVRVGAPAS